MSKRLFAGAVFFVVLGTTVPASAESSAEVRDLARRAQSDPSALERLRQVHDVDGRPVDYGRALAGAEGGDLQRRLRTIEEGAGNEPPVPLTGNAPQREAARILDSSKYKPAQPPRPLRGAIRKVGEWLSPVLEPIGRFLAPVGRFLKRVFSNAAAVGIMAFVVIALAALIAARMASRRNRMASEASGGAGRGGTGAVDPAELEKAADEAERRGDYEHAFRLRFLAGVLRLDKAGAIAYRHSATTGELLREVRSQTFRPLARSFDEIAYGGRQAQPEDVAKAKADWPRVLEEARR